MNLDRNELLLLSRGGRVPRARSTRPVPRPPGRDGPRLFTTLGQSVRWGIRRRPRRGAELDVHAYLELEFAVDEER